MYALDNTPDSEVWMQHRYLFDAEELRSRPRWKAAAKVGTTFGGNGDALLMQIGEQAVPSQHRSTTHMQADQLAPGELIVTSKVYHSPLSLVQSDFPLAWEKGHTDTVGAMTCVAAINPCTGNLVRLQPVRESLRRQCAAACVRNPGKNGPPDDA